MEKNLEENANPSKLQELLQEFYKLEGNKMPENRKRLNHYIIRIKQDIQDDHELNNFTKMIKTTDVMQQNLKIEILLQLRRDDQLLQILKEADSISTAKITTNLTFISNVFSKMKCEEFFKTIAPFIPFSATLKIINRLGKVLSDEMLAEEYFEAVRLNYGLHLAKAILPACRIDFAKCVIEINNLCLTSRELLRFASKDNTFLRFYFDMLWKYDIVVYVNEYYRKVTQYVGKTDADFFWQLHLVYKFKTDRCVKWFGEGVFNFLFSNDASKTTNRQNVFRIFKARTVYNVLKRRGQIYILLANFCEGDENEFFKIYFESNSQEFSFIHKFLEGMPTLAYSDLHKAYELKFGKNLLNNTKLFNEDWLKRMSSLNRAIVLDNLSEENHDLYYLYNLEKSIPLLKEKLKNDIENSEFYLMQMYKSCEYYKNEDVLFEVLSYIIQEHRGEHKVIDDITERVLHRWQHIEKLKPKFWNLIDEIISITLYSDEITTPRSIGCYRSKRVLHNINQGTPFNNLLLSVINMKKLPCVYLGKTAASDKINYEKVRILFQCIKTNVYETDFCCDILSILGEIVSFNAHNKTNQIPLFVYANIIEVCGFSREHWLSEIIRKQASNDPTNDYFYDLFWTSVASIWGLKRCRFVQANPAVYMKHISLNSDIIRDVLPQVRLHYFPVEIKNALHNYCLDVLRIDDYTPSRLAAVSKLILKVNESVFLEIIKKICFYKRDSHPSIITVLTHFLTRMKNIFEVFPICLELYKNQGRENHQTAVLRCLKLMPLYQSKKSINNLSESPLIRLRKLSVSAAGILLMNDDLAQFVSQMNAKETDPDIMRKLCRRSFHLFIRHQNDLHWTLLKRNINLSGCESGFISRFWWELHKISPEYLQKFVSYTFAIIIKGGSANEWTKTLAVRLNSRSILENLNTTFVQNMMKSLKFHERRMNYRYQSCYADNYHLEFIFLTSGEKQTILLECTFEQLKEYKEKNWCDFPQKSKFDKVYGFAMKFCAYVLKSKPQNGIVNKFCSEWRVIFPPDTHLEFLLLEFLDLFFDCKCDVEEFCKKSNKLMRDYIAKYGEIILQIYSEELMRFIRVAKIYKMNFFTSFMHSNPDRLSYCAILKILPHITWVKYVPDSKLITLMERFRLDTDLSVRLHCSHYFFKTSRAIRY